MTDTPEPQSASERVRDRTYWNLKAAGYNPLDVDRETWKAAADQARVELVEAGFLNRCLGCSAVVLPSDPALCETCELHAEHVDALGSDEARRGEATR